MLLYIYMRVENWKSILVRFLNSVNYNGFYKLLKKEHLGIEDKHEDVEYVPC